MQTVSSRERLFAAAGPVLRGPGTWDSEVGDPASGVAACPYAPGPKPEAFS